MATHQSPLAVVVKGALAGAAGTAVMSAFIERAPELMDRAGLRSDEPPAPPDEPQAASSPTEELAERVTEGRLPREARASAGEAIHWGYGAAWGAYFAVIQSTFRPPSIIHGLFLGGLMTAVAVKLVPQLGLAPAPRTRDELITSAASHGVFGVVTAIVYRILNLGRRG
jgi:putative membrane protein